MIKTLINPQNLPQPRGYNHAVRAWPVGRMLVLSGQVGWTANEQFVSKELLGQFSQGATQFFGLHGITEFHAPQNFRGKTGNTRKDNIFALGKRIADAQDPMIGNAYNVPGKSFFRQ